MAAAHRIDLDSSIAYGDHVSDAPLLSLTGRAVTVGGQDLRRLAAHHCWDRLPKAPAPPAVPLPAPNPTPPGAMPCGSPSSAPTEPARPPDHRRHGPHRPPAAHGTPMQDPAGSRPKPLEQTTEPELIQFVVRRHTERLLAEAAHSEGLLSDGSLFHESAKLGTVKRAALARTWEDTGIVRRLERCW
ncbi:hypothetical protein [Streptomyces sp. NPDC001658]